MKILVVEDYDKLLSTVNTFLGKNGFDVTAVSGPQEAYDKMEETSFDLILSDIMMPQIDGFEFAESVRRLDQNIPFIFMTARDDFTATERGFRLGIDDFLVKPVNLDELLLRIQAVLRRSNIYSSHKLELPNVTLDEEEHTVYVKGEEVQVTVREFNILCKMLSFPKKTFTRQQLMDEFWKSESASSSRTVDVYMTRLREKFAAQDDFEILTVHGLGYKAVLKSNE